MIENIILPVLEVSINQYLRLDPEIPEKLIKFSGKVVEVELRDLGLSFFMQFSEQAIKITTQHLGAVDTNISGTVWGMLRLGLGPNIADQRGLFQGEVSINGDVNLGQEVKHLLDSVDIDWEEHLASIVGDTPARMLADFGKGIFSWGSYNCGRAKENMTEYLQEEIRLMPPREELNDFYADVDELRMYVDRVDARLLRLDSKLQEHKPDGAGK